ncbi:unnamed protein product [Prorocentrum cordatum]|uniref:RING-type domain-containing protein n=1 Tax=Prorocentrum cordatum TaxID=2364126 RepID=A0ABN9SSF4_9DINO|nr:unnamed protein product [Polarella glacialis]CAK0834851.1 unnamed protein product [Polarella glacialis]
MAPLDAEDEETAEIFSCGICDDLMLGPTTLGCCGRSFCRRCLRQWLRTSVHTAGVPRCPGGCTAKVPFRLPAVSVSLRSAMEQLVPERLAQRRREAEADGEAQEEVCFGGFKAWQEVAANRDIIFGRKVGVRQGTPGILVGNFTDDHHVTVRFDEREDGSDLCVNVLPEALMAPLPGGFRLSQRVVALYDLLLNGEIGVRLGTPGTVVGSLGEDRLMVLFDVRAADAVTGQGGPVSVSFREVAPQRLLVGGYCIGQRVQSAMDLVVGNRIVVNAGNPGAVLAEFSDTRLTVAFDAPQGGAQSCFNVLPVEIRQWCEPPSSLPVGSEVQATRDLLVADSVVVRGGEIGTVLSGIDEAQVFVSFRGGADGGGPHTLALGLDAVRRTGRPVEVD